jgi:hypothetical protein
VQRQSTGALSQVAPIRIAQCDLISRRDRNGYASASDSIPSPQPSAFSAPPSYLRYDPAGADRDCGDFATHEEAQAFFVAADGPARDPHRLDGDSDGEAVRARHTNNRN